MSLSSIAALPFTEASSSGVAPSRFAADTFAPARISESAVSRSSARTAQCSAVVPSLCGALTSAFRCSNERTASLFPFMTASATSLAAAAIRLATGSNATTISPSFLRICVPLANCVRPLRRFLLLALKPATQYRTSQKIVEFVHQAVQAEQRGNLRPVPDFMHKCVDYNFPGRGCYGINQDLEIPRRIPFLWGQGFDQFLQFLPASLSESKECVDVVSRDRSIIG